MNAATRALVGVLACGGFVFARVPGLSDGAWAHALLLFAALVLVPLALELFRDAEEAPAPARWFNWVERLQLPAGLALLVACWIPPGRLAAAAALPWVGLTAAMAIIGLWRVQQGGLRRDLDGLCRDAALIFAVIGGAWTLADRLGYRPLGFDPAIVALTAVHFHFAGLLLPLFAGLVQRELFFWRLASRAAVGVVLGVPAVAVGITMTQLGAGPSVEAAAGCGLALAGMVVGILHVRIATDGRQPITTRLLLAIAGVSLFIGMVLAALYAMRAFVAPFPWLGIPQMRMLHGTVNALGFGGCGVLAWRRMARGRDRI
ncbi:MAG: YndJ family transporter [Opitutaceae bacterium]